MSSVLRQDFQVSFRYEVLFTSGLFQAENPLLADLISSGQDGYSPVRLLFVVDRGVSQAHPRLLADIERYCSARPDRISMPIAPLVVPGGETAKNRSRLTGEIHAAINEGGICRHSYVVAIGGGAVIDMVGFAAATAHRGVRLIRVPTTVLAQNDSAVGVKNSVNAFGKKNFLGAFAPPFAVINDTEFLKTLSPRDWRSGMAEAVKVGLIKDAAFFESLESNAVLLAARDMAAMAKLIHRCAQLHLEHIASADPFESGSSRPLDYGHWAAHKLEQLTDYRLRHGEAVAIGLAIDTTYSYLDGRLSEAEWRRVISLLLALGFELTAPELGEHLSDPGHPRSLLRGLTEFREHLGGQLTIMLLEEIGRGVEVHEIDTGLVERSIALLGRDGGPLRRAEASKDAETAVVYFGGSNHGFSHTRLSTKPAAIGG